MVPVEPMVAQIASAAVVPVEPMVVQIASAAEVKMAPSHLSDDD